MPPLQPSKHVRQLRAAVGIAVLPSVEKRIVAQGCEIEQLCIDFAKVSLILAVNLSEETPGAATPAEAISSDYSL